MTPDSCSILKEFLEAVKAENILQRHVGLCSNFNYFCIVRAFPCRETAYAREIFRNMMCDFPKYTGDPTYPLVLQDGYDKDLEAMVDFYSPYASSGAIRLEFVDWALKEIAQNRVSYMKS